MFGFLKNKKKTPVQLFPFAVETIVMLDENTVLDRFTSTILARSKRDAKDQIKSRAFIKVGAVANRKRITELAKKAKP